MTDQKELDHIKSQARSARTASAKARTAGDQARAEKYQARADKLTKSVIERLGR